MHEHTEARRGGAFIFTELGGNASRKDVIIEAGKPLVAGTALGRITASGKYAPYTPNATNGLQTASAILVNPHRDASVDKSMPVVLGQAKVNRSELDWGDATPSQIEAGIADLANVAIEVSCTN